MNINPLLDFIATYESRGDYNIVWGGIRREHRPPKPLVEMTVAEVLAWQDSIDPQYMSEAAGRYQIMEDTLRGLNRQLGLSDALFDKGTQDSLAIHLMRRRGLSDYLRGEISAEQFANNLAKEWASLPLVRDQWGRKRGFSYYAGDGLNKSHVKPDAFLAAVKAVREGDRPEPRLPPDVEPIAPKPRGLWAVILDALRRIFRGM